MKRAMHNSKYFAGIVLLGSILIAVSSCVPQTVQPAVIVSQLHLTAQQCLDQGITLSEKGTYELAIPEFTKAIGLDPKLARAYFCRGVAYGKQKQFALAIDDFSTAINLDPEYEDAYLARGKIYPYITDWDKAISDCNRVIQFDPHNAEAVYVLGLAFLGKKDYSGAVACFNMPFDTDIAVNDLKDIKNLIDLVVPPGGLILLDVACSTSTGVNCRGDPVPYDNTVKVHIFINSGGSGIEISTINISPAIEGSSELNNISSKYFYHSGPEFLVAHISSQTPPYQISSCTISYKTINDLTVNRSNAVGGARVYLDGTVQICPIN